MIVEIATPLRLRAMLSSAIVSLTYVETGYRELKYLLNSLTYDGDADTTVRTISGLKGSG